MERIERVGECTAHVNLVLFAWWSGYTNRGLTEEDERGRGGGGRGGGGREGVENDALMITVQQRMRFMLVVVVVASKHLSGPTQRPILPSSEETHLFSPTLCRHRSVVRMQVAR